MKNIEITNSRVNLVKDSNILAIGTVTLNDSIVISRNKII